MKEKEVNNRLPCIGCYGEEDEMCSDCDDSKKCKREKEIIMAKITGTKAVAKTKLEFDTDLIEDPETRMDTLSDMSPALLKKVAEHYEIELSGKSKNQMLLDIDNDFESKENAGKEDSEEEVEEETGFDAEELADLIAKTTKGNKAKILEVIVDYLTSFEDDEEEEEVEVEEPKAKGKAVAKKPVVDEEDDEDEEEEPKAKGKAVAKKPVVDEEDDEDDEDEEDEPKAKGKAIAKKPVVDEEDDEDEDEEEVEEKPKLTIPASLLKAISTAGLKQKLSEDSMIITDTKNKILATIKSDGKITYLIPTSVPKGVKIIAKFAGKPAMDVKDIKGITVLISKMS